MRQNHAPTGAILDVVDALKQTKIQVLGCVFNNVQNWDWMSGRDYQPAAGQNEGHRRQRGDRI